MNLLKELNTHHSRSNTHRHKLLKQEFARIRHSHQRNLKGKKKEVISKVVLK